MPIKKPSQSNNSVNTLATQGIDIVNDKAAEEFINRSNKAPAPEQPSKPKRKAKIPMMMRIDQDLLDRIDARAESEGISRSAWISLTCARALKSTP